jgi:hypothetical protein
VSVLAGIAADTGLEPFVNYLTSVVRQVVPLLFVVARGAQRPHSHPTRSAAYSTVDKVREFCCASSKAANSAKSAIISAALIAKLISLDMLRRSLQRRTDSITERI